MQSLLRHRWMGKASFRAKGLAGIVEKKLKR